MACSPSACCGGGNGQSRRGRLLAEIGAPGSTVGYASGTLSVLSSAARLTGERRTRSHGSRPDLLGRRAGRVLGHHATGAALIINNDQIWPPRREVVEDCDEIAANVYGGTHADHATLPSN